MIAQRKFDQKDIEAKLKMQGLTVERFSSFTFVKNDEKYINVRLIKRTFYELCLLKKSDA